MKWICEKNIVSDQCIREVERILKVEFPKDFVENIKKYDGGYPKPNKITVAGKDEVLNNLVSFLKEDASFILDIFTNTEGLQGYNLIPIAEDPFGNLFCYSFKVTSCEIVFWSHEENAIEHVCNNFEDLVLMLHN